MKLTKVEKKEKSTVELSILVEKDVFEKACEQAYHQNVGKMNVPGFRKGKAPRKMLEKLYGEGVFFEDAMNLCYPEAYEEAVKESGIEPVGRPNLTDFDLVEGDFTFKAIVPVKPEITLKAYKDIEAEKETVTVSDEDVQDEIDRLAERNSRLVSVTRKAENGDTLLFDFEGFVDGVAFEGGKAESFSLKLGSGQFIPGFEEQLVGTSADESLDVNVTFPEEYQEKTLAGKPAVFKCTVHEVKESQKPEIDDEFAKDVSEFDTLDAYKADLKDKMLKGKETAAQNAFDEAVMDKIVEGMEGEIPDAMKDDQLDRIVEDYAYRVQMQGMDFEQYLKMNGMEIASFRRLFDDQAMRQVKVRLALEKVAMLEKLEVAAEDIEAEFKTLAEQNKMAVERVKELLPEASLKADLLVQKAVELVKASAKAVEPKEEPKEESEDADVKPAKKPAAKKTSVKADGEKKPAAKKTVKKETKED